MSYQIPHYFVFSLSAISVVSSRSHHNALFGDLGLSALSTDIIMSRMSVAVKEYVFNLFSRTFQSVSSSILEVSSGL